MRPNSLRDITLVTENLYYVNILGSSGIITPHVSLSVLSMIWIFMDTFWIYPKNPIDGIQWVRISPYARERRQLKIKLYFYG